jgi:hypothetical protein
VPAKKSTADRGRQPARHLPRGKESDLAWPQDATQLAVVVGHFWRAK